MTTITENTTIKKVVGRKEKEIIDIVNNKHLSSDEKITDLEDFGKNFPEEKESVKNAIDSIRDSKKAPAKKTPKKTDGHEEMLKEIIKEEQEVTRILEATEKKTAKKESLLDVIGAEAPKRVTYHNEYKPTEEPTEATEFTKVDELEEKYQENLSTLIDMNKKLNSMHEKNESLQSKLDIIKSDSVQLVVPQGLIAKSVNDSVAKVHNNYLETIKEGQELLDMLDANDVKTSIDTIKDYKDRLVDAEDRINDLKDDFVRTDDLEYEIESYTGYYVEEDEIERMIDNAIDNIDQDNDYVEMNDFRHDFGELERRVDDLTAIIESKQSRVTMFTRLINWFKNLFNKVSPISND